MDMTDTIQPTSDQLDAVDLLGGPRTFTISKVEKNDGDQPVNIHLAEFPRVWRPGKSMRRVLVYAWGPDATAYVGRRVTLYCDPNVKFGGETVGGTRISHLSHIAKALTIPLLVTRGKSAMFRVAPLPDAPPAAEQPASKPLAQRVTDAVRAFDGIGVTVAQLEERQGKPSGDWTEVDVEHLGTLYGSLKKGETSKDDEFPVDPTTGPDWSPDGAA